MPSGQSQKCCCLRTCGKKKECVEKEKDEDKKEKDNRDGVCIAAYHKAQPEVRDLSTGCKRPRPFDDANFPPSKRAQLDEDIFQDTNAAISFRSLNCTKHTVERIVNS